MNSICFYAVLHHHCQSKKLLPLHQRIPLGKLLVHDHVLRPAFEIQDYAKGMFFMYNLIMRTCFTPKRVVLVQGLVPFIGIL